MGAHHQDQRSNHPTPQRGASWAASGEHPPATPTEGPNFSTPEQAFSTQLVYILHSLIVSFQEKSCMAFVLLFFWVILFCLLNHQDNFCSTARNLPLTAAEKGPLLPPTSAQPLALPSQGTQSAEPRETQRSWCPAVRRPNSTSSPPTSGTRPGEQNS